MNYLLPSPERLKVLNKPLDSRLVSQVAMRGIVPERLKVMNNALFRYHGQDGMERWLGLGAMASNLSRIALAKH